MNREYIHFFLKKIAVVILVGFSLQTHANQVPDNIELDALTALYNSTDGDNWTTNVNWLNGTTSNDFGTWFNVDVENGDVVAIHLNNNNLTGPLPSEIGNLSELKRLYLDGNNIIGNIPVELYSIQGLEELNLGINQLSGTIPTEIGNLTNLTFLSLYQNQLSGSIPNSIGNLTALKTIYLYSNELSGVIPEEIENLTSLEYLYLDVNNLKGSIPAGLFEISNLTLTVGANNITSLPDITGVDVSTVYFSMYYNQITFEYLENYFTGTGVTEFSNLQYNPMNILGNDTSFYISSGETITLTYNIGGKQTNYQWQKLEGSNWTDLVDETNEDLVFTNFSPEDAGSYRLTATNDLVTGLELTTRVFEVGFESCGYVTTIQDSGPGSLRSAIVCANSGLIDSIIFAIPGAGEHRIYLETELESYQEIDTLVIDGVGHKIILDGSNISSNQSQKFEITNTIVKNITFKKLFTGVELITGYAEVSNCVFDSCTTAISEPGGGDIVNGNSLINNNIITNCNTGIALGNINSIGGSPIKIRNNYIYDCDRGINGGYLPSIWIENNFLGIDENGNSAPIDEYLINLANGQPDSLIIRENVLFSNQSIGFDALRLNAIYNSRHFIVERNSIGVDMEGNVGSINGHGIALPAINSDFGIDIKGNIISNISSSGIYLVNSQNINLDDNIIYNSGEHGIHSTLLTDSILIKNNQIYSVVEHGIYLESANEQGVISGNYIGTNNNGDLLSNGGYGIYLQSSTLDSLLNNNISNNVSGGIFIHNNNLYVEGNTITNNGTHGLIITNGTNYLSFLNNNVSDNLSSGIFFTNSSSNNLIEANTITGNKVGLESMFSSSNNQILQNTIENNDSIGITFHDGSGSSFFVENSILNNGGAGLLFYNGSSGNEVFNNIISNHDSIGISSQSGSSNNKFSQNQIFNASQKSIKLYLLTGSPGNNAKDTATIITHNIVGNTLTLSGTGVDDDTVEVFTNKGLPENALAYVGHARVAGGVWSLDIPEGEFYNTGKTNFYVTTATDQGGNTSELSMPYAVQGPCGVVSSLADSGPGTLRAAIECVNAGTVDTITFDLGSNGVADTIFVNSAFPVINNRVVIDGSTDADYVGPRPSVWVKVADNAVTTGYQFNVNSPKSVFKAIGINANDYSGIQVVGGVDSVKIIQNEFVNVGSAIQINSNSEYSIIDNNIIGIYGKESSTQGILAIGKHTSITNNFFGNLSWYSLSTGGDSSTVKNNILGRNPEGEGVMHDGGGWMSIGSDYNVISENIISNTPGSCIDITGSLNYVYNNTMSLNDSIDLVQPTYGVIIGGIFSTNNTIFNNTIENVSNSGVFINNAALIRHKISQNTFSNIGSGAPTANSNKAIMLGNSSNNSKDTATITTYNLTPTTLTLSGTSSPEDSIEVFINDGIAQNALEYIGTAKTDASGNWSIDLNRGDVFVDGNLNFYVTTATDMDGNTSELSNPFVIYPESCVVTNTNDFGQGSLRAALECTALKPGPDTISFNISGNNDHEITLTTPLPNISDTVIINGNTQPTGEVIINGPGSINGFYFQNTANSGVLDVDMNNVSNGVIFSPCDNCIVDSCVINAVSNGIAVYNGSSSPIIRNNLISDVGVGVYLATEVNKGIIENNTISGTRGPSINITNNCDSNRIQNNVLSGGNNIGISVCCSQRNVVESNTLTNFGVGGIEIYGSSDSGLYLNNLITYCSNYGVRIYAGSSFNSLVGNLIGNVDGIGITLEPGAKYNYLDSNYIGINSTFDSLGIANYGIQIRPGCNANHINNNYIGYCGNDAIRNNTDSTIITNNFIGGAMNEVFPNAGYGIYFDTPSNSTRTLKNEIRNNDGGIFLDVFAGSKNFFSENILVNNNAIPILLETRIGGGNAIIYANNDKKTPVINSISEIDDEYTIEVSTEVDDILIELFLSDETKTDAVKFIPSNFIEISPGIWQATIQVVEPNPTFLVSSTAADSSTSQLGYDCFTVVNTNDAGTGSLRAAIGCANETPDPNTIIFSLSDTVSPKINLSTPLPEIEYSLNIDASELSEPLELIGNGGGNGLSYEITATDNSVRNMHISNFANGIEMGQQIRGKISIEDVWLYNNATGLLTFTDTTELSGVYIGENTANGITADGLTIIADSCSIIDNGGHGIFKRYSLSYLYLTNSLVSGNGDDGINMNRVQAFEIHNCKIGVDSSGTQKHANDGHGIYVTFSGPGLITNSIISGNNGDGIHDPDRVPIEIYGCYIGTNEYGDNLGNTGNGILGRQSFLTIGADDSDSLNIIGYNGGDGINLQGSASIISGNYVGVFPDNSDIHNGKNGLVLQSGMTASNNIIGFNLENGILINGAGNTIEKNHIGIGLNGENFGNILYGLELRGSDDILYNQIGFNNLGGIHSITNFNLVSKNIFKNNNDLAIDWDTFKDTATITSQNIVSYELTLQGTGPDTDSVEVFYSDGTPENALHYAETAYINGGNWSMTLPDDGGETFTPFRDNYYVTTSTNAAQTSTSELSQPFFVPAYICDFTSTDLLEDTLGVCKNDSLLLESPSNITSRWYKNGFLYSNEPSLYTKTGGEYILELEDSYGCKTHDTIQVIENPLPLISDFLVSSYTGIEDELVIVNVSYTQPDSVVWDFGEAIAEDQGTYFILNFPTIGTYDITLTAYLDYCTKTISKTVEVLENYTSPSDNINAAFDFKTVQLYPNPTTGQFTADISLIEAKTVEVTIFNAQSNVVEQTTLTGDNKYTTSFNIEAQPPGNYFLRFTTNSDTRIIRVIKQ